ncbi:hypothetical protein ACGFX8_37795, partial [Streptomyces sp. NPDC048362]|uniref:hypothetical protein n=1 Tax=Streptomyces sp. NPDC048362 TaxID=3365539 RepID=UPI0037112B38
LTGIADPSADRDTRANFPVSEVISAALPAFLTSKWRDRIGWRGQMRLWGEAAVEGLQRPLPAAGSAFGAGAGPIGGTSSVTRTLTDPDAP